MNAATLTPGDVVTLHNKDREYRAHYRRHDTVAVVVEVTYGGGIDSMPSVIRWDDPDRWISNPRTDQAYYLADEDGDAISGLPPERE